MDNQTDRIAISISRISMLTRDKNDDGDYFWHINQLCVLHVEMKAYIENL